VKSVRCEGDGARSQFFGVRRLPGVSASLRVVGGTVLGAVSGMFLAVPAAMLADLLLIDDGAFEAGMALAFLGLVAAGFGFWVGAAAGLAIALMLQATRRDRLSRRALTLGSLATAGIWVLYGLRVLQSIPPADYLLVQFLWTVVSLGALWTIAATVFVRSRCKTDRAPLQTRTVRANP
jgi:hypothetical protein